MVRTITEFIFIFIVLLGIALFWGDSTLTTEGLLIIVHPVQTFLVILVTTTFIAYLLVATGIDYGSGKQKEAQELTWLWKLLAATAFAACLYILTHTTVKVGESDYQDSKVISI